MTPLHRDPHFCFRFADDRLIPRFHLDGVEPGRRVAVYRLDPLTGNPADLLVRAVVGDGGWVDLSEPLVVRAGEGFIAVPETRLAIREAAPADHAAVRDLTRLAFGQADEANLVDARRAGVAPGSGDAGTGPNDCPFFSRPEPGRSDHLTCRNIAIYLHQEDAMGTKTTPKTTPPLTDLAALEQAAECLKALAHPHRLRIVQMLLRGRYTVGELADACGIASHMASEHLRLMQRCGFLSCEKEGRNAYYAVAEPHLANIMACVEARFGGGQGVVFFSFPNMSHYRDIFEIRPCKEPDMSVPTIAPRQLEELRSAGRPVDLMDVRTPMEYREVHVPFAHNVPLDRLDPAAVQRDRTATSEEPLYVICRSGSRGRQACERLAAAGLSVVNVEGGTLAWADAGLPVVRGKKTISLERQVRIAAGLLVLIGVVLGWLVHPAFVGLSAFIGAGLVFAGVTDTCGMGLLLARMPWNRVAEPAACGVR